MQQLLLCLILFCIHTISLRAQLESNDNWDLANTYNASTHVFYGEVVKRIPERNFKTGAMGVEARSIDEDTLPLEPIIWAHAQELSFSIKESLKQPLTDQFAAYLPDPDLRVWTHLMNDTGDVFLIKPEAVAPRIAQLQQGDRGLFFVRSFYGSNIPVIYRARFGHDAEIDLDILRTYQAANGQVTLQEVILQEKLRAQQIAAREAKAFKDFEDEYYKILRIQDLEIRTSLLNDLITKLGFEGRWNYYDYKERTIEKYGTQLKENEIPSVPTDLKEKLWHDISGELKKIDVIRKARKPIK